MKVVNRVSVGLRRTHSVWVLYGASSSPFRQVGIIETLHLSPACSGVLSWLRALCCLAQLDVTMASRPHTIASTVCWEFCVTICPSCLFHRTVKRMRGGIRGSPSLSIVSVGTSRCF